MPRSALTPQVIADIYAAATDEQLWPQFSSTIAKANGIEAVSVWLTESNRVIDASMAKVYQPFLAPYVAHFAKLDPWAASLARNPLEKIMIGFEHMREDELVKTEFYNDFARRGGMFRPIGVKMQLAPGVYATMGSENPFTRKPLEQSDKRRISAVLPHVRNALKLRWRQQHSGRRGGLHEAALQAYSFAVVICDMDGRVKFANVAADALAREGAGLLMTRGRLGAIDPKQALELARLVRDAALGGAGGAIALAGRDGAMAAFGLVTPLPRPLHETHGHGHALVSLRAAAERPVPPEASLVTMFGLSPTQASIAIAIANGMTPEDIAGERGVRISTLRTHLAEIFARTGAKTQRELVRLLASVPTLRRSD